MLGEHLVVVGNPLREGINRDGEPVVKLKLRGDLAGLHDDMAAVGCRTSNTWAFRPLACPRNNGSPGMPVITVQMPLVTWYTLLTESASMSLSCSQNRSESPGVPPRTRRGAHLDLFLGCNHHRVRASDTHSRQSASLDALEGVLCARLSWRLRPTSPFVRRMLCQDPPPRTHQSGTSAPRG